MRLNLFSSTALSAFALALTPAPALAQTAASTAEQTAAAANEAAATDTSDSDIQEIVVTAQKRAESINDVPISITAVTGAQLQAAGIVDTASLAKVVPGFVVANTYFGSPVYYLRGVGFYDTAIAARPAVALYADEAPISFPIMAKGTTLDLERVEVLKGPQGLLFGSNATGGAINFIAAKPTRDFAAGAGLSFGRFNSLLLDGFVSGPLSEDVRARLAVQRETMDDWQRGYTVDRTNGSKNISSGRATLQADASDALRFQVTASGTIDHSDTISPQLIGRDTTLTLISPAFLAYPLAPAGSIRATDVSTTFADGKTLRRDDWTWQLALRADYDVSDDLTLTSLSSLSRAGQDHAYDADGTALAQTNLSLEGKVRTAFQEFRGAGSIGSFNYIVGANYQHDKSDELVTFLLPDGRSGRVFLALLGAPPIDLVPEIAAQSTDSWAAYASGDVDLTDTLKLRGGVRYTETKTDFAACVQAGGNLRYAIGISRVLGTPTPGLGQCATFTRTATAPPTAGLVVNELDEDNISWKVGLDYKPGDDTLFYASASRGYKAGAFSNISAVFADQYVPVPQESLLAYEVGVKTDLIPDVLHLNAAAFYYDYSDKQLLGTVPVPVFVRLTSLVSVPKSHVQGFEADIALRAAEGLTFRAAGTYVDTKVDSNFAGNSAFGAPVNFKGSAFPNTPKWQGNASVDYTWPLSDSLNAITNVAAQYRGKSNSDFVPDPRLAVPSYTVFDARAGVETADGQWRLQAWVRNFTNELTYSTVVVRTEAIVRTVGMPRTFGLSAAWRY